MSMHGQHSLSTSINATNSVIPVTPQHAIDPGRPDTTIVPIDVREEYMPDPNAPSGDTGPVGTISYDIVRPNNGRVNVKIPIESFSTEFESSHGMSLTYVGGTRVTVMGRGWALTGASVISRCGRDYFTDGNTSAVSLDDDCWSLDGVRLIFEGVSGTLRRYRTQVGNTLALQDAGGNFTVLHPDGSKSYYAESDSLRHYVTRHVTLDGKVTSYHYTSTPFGYRLLTSVDYGEGRQLAMSYKRLYPSLEPDGRTKYVAGVPVEQRHRLDSLHLMKDGCTLATYTLEYPLDMRPETQPRMICQLDSSGVKAFRPLKLAYHGQGQRKFTKKWKRLGRMLAVDDHDMSKLIVVRGRFDPGSESEGFMLFANRQSYVREFVSETGCVYRSDYTPADKIIVTTCMHNDGLDLPCAEIETDTCFVEALAMDVDGCAGDELVRINNQVFGSQDVTTITVFTESAGEMVRRYSRTHSMPAMAVNGLPTVRPKSFLPGDFDGDGRADLLVLTYSTPDLDNTPARADILDLMTGANKGTFTIDSCASYNYYSDNGQWTDEEKWLCFNRSDRVLVLDHDGDGKKELGIINSHGLFIHSFCIDNCSSLTMSRLQADCPVTLADFESLAPFVCDLNGDGNTDIATVRKKPATGNGDIGRVVMLSDGTGKFLTEISLAQPGSHGGNVALTDYDRDGCTDIINNNGAGLEALQLPPNSHLVGGNTFDGRVVSLAAIRPDGEVLLYNYENPVDVACTLAALQDGSGKEHMFTHGRLFLSHDSGYSPDHFEYPLCAAAEGMLVNTRERMSAGSVPLANWSFSYSGPTMHRQGLGFLGFETMTSCDSVTGHHSLEEYSAEHLGALRHQVTDHTERELALDKAVGQNRHITIMTTSEAKLDKATGVTATVAYTHDSYGNVLSATTTYPGGISKTETNEYHNVDSAGVWLIGLERRHTESVTRGGQSMTQGRTTGYTRSWLPDTIVTWCGSEQQPVSTRVIRYDSDKRPDRIRTRAYQGSWLTRHIGYSGTSRLPQFISDEQDIRTTCSYGDYGLTQSSLSPEIMEWFDDDDMPVIPIDGPIGRPGNADGLNDVGSGIVAPDPVTLPQLTTAYHYDSFGRQDSITAPDGAAKAVALCWATDVPGATYMSELTETGKPTARTWHDALGRKVRSAVQRYDGSWAYTLHEYDARGRLSRESMPTATGSSNSWTTYSYDAFDRLTEKRYPDGHSDLYSYDGLSTTSTIDGVTTTRTVDALGNLVAVEDAGGTLQYTLRADGQPSQILAPGGIATTFDYDGYGRRTAIHDPSAGTRTTAYDANGRVASETDARGKSVASTYTAKGLLVTHTFDDGPTVTYGYNSWNQPTSMTGSDGHSKSWTYNSLSQLATETVDGFTKSYTYDKNLVASVAYSKDNGYICSENYSRMNGHLTSITLNTGDTLWTLRKQNPRLLPTRIGLGGLNMSLSYDDRGQVTSRVVTGGDDESLQSLRYWYSAATGNMTEREDLVRGTDEMFEYDNLNRLTDIELYSPSLGYRDRSTTYDGKGNILSHSTAGQYGYGTAKPYAFNELLTASPLIPAREQHISFNAMQQPDTISEGGYTAAFSYYGDMGRATMLVTDSLGGTETRAYYDQQYNEFAKTMNNTTQTKRVLWLGGTPYDAPAALVKDYVESDWRLVHVLRDNLGSITHVVDTAGTVLQELSYSAWGLLRDPQTLEPYGPDAQPELLLGRGYTGHEHLPWFGLVNMNARLYDPAVGRFLSPDPLVQAPDNTQNYNRYSYCLNNPLRYVDEDGRNHYYLNPWLGWQYQQYEQSDYMGVMLPGIVVYGGRNTWSRWSSYIEAPFSYSSWQGGMPGYHDWRENRFGAPVSYYSNEYRFSGDGHGRSKQTSSNIYNTLGNTSIAINTMSSLPTVVETTWDNVVRKNLNIPLLNKVNPSDYAQGLKTIDPITKEVKPAVDMVKAAKFVKGVGQSLMWADLGVTAVLAINDMAQKKYVSATARTIVSLSTAAISVFVPGVGPVIAFGIGMADAMWGQQFYDCIQETYDNW